MERHIKLSDEHCVTLGEILLRELTSRRIKLESYQKTFGDRVPREIEVEKNSLTAEADALQTLIEQLPI